MNLSISFVLFFTGLLFLLVVGKLYAIRKLSFFFLMENFDACNQRELDCEINEGNQLLFSPTYVTSDIRIEMEKELFKER